MYNLDAHGVVTYMNPEAERLFGWKSEELLGRRLHDVIHYKRPDGSPFPIEECAGFRVLRDGQVLKDFEDAFLKKDGSFFPVSYSSSPLWDRDGKIVGLVIVFQDITERKRAEDALREARDLLVKTNEELEVRVAKRTAELEEANRALLRDMEERKKLEAQLLQSQKMESIGVLAGGIAHDFNNILNIIQGYVSLLENGALSAEETAESLKVINETIQRGSGVVQQLLTLARKTESRLELTDANRLLDGLIKLLRETFPKTIEIKADPAGELPAVLADPNQITQALLNLCVNARDAMPGGGTLTITARVVDGPELTDGEEKAERYVRIEVSDTGMGMDESIRKRIFEPFFTTKDVGQGTGLGLPVVYGIVKNHNGIIHVDSAPRRGTTFNVYLPVALSGEKPEVESAPEKDISSKELQPNDRGTILVVEDEELLLRLLKNILSKQGHRILTAADGEEAIEIYRRHKDAIDIILLDIGLPKMAGRDVLLKIKNEKPDAKIVVISGYLEPEVKSEIEQTGVRHFFRKPYTLGDLVKTLQGLIE